jgi:hypothetical protein
MANRFGYNSQRWIQQDWRYIIYSNKDGRGMKRFKFDPSCGKKGGVTASGKVRLCLPRQVIENLIKTKEGRDALHEQVRRKLAAKRGQNVQYNPIVLAEFKRFQKADTFVDTPKGKAKAKPAPKPKAKPKAAPKPKAKPKKQGKPIQTQLFRRNPNLLQDGTIEKIQLMKELTKGKNPITIEKYVSIIKKSFGSVDVVDLVTFYIDNPITIDVKNANLFVETAEGLRYDEKRIRYMNGAWLIVDSKEKRDPLTQRILGRIRLASKRVKLTKQIQVLETAQVYEQMFSQLLDFGSFSKGSEFQARSLFAFVGASNFKSLLPKFQKFPPFPKRSRPFPELYLFQAKNPQQFLAPILKGFYISQRAYPLLQGELEKQEGNT